MTSSSSSTSSCDEMDLSKLSKVLSGSSESVPTIDESLYSRQLYALGQEAMKKLVTGNVLISGIGGLAVEIAKNIILAGVKSVTLQYYEEKFQDCPSTLRDLSSNFCLSESNIYDNNNSRAEKCVEYLQELNPHVLVKSWRGEPSVDFMKKEKIQVVVLSEGFLGGGGGGGGGGGKEKIIQFSNECHERGVYLIFCETRGLFARVFCDFGEKFVVLDDDQESRFLVKHFDLEKGLVSCDPKSDHKLVEGDFVQFFVEEENSKKNEKIITKQVEKVFNTHQFSIDFSGDERKLIDCSSSKYTAIKVKKPMEIYFDSLERSIQSPKFMIPDWTKPMDNSLSVHLLFLAMDEFFIKNGRLPQGNSQDWIWVYGTAHEIMSHYENKVEINKNLAKAFVSGCQGSLSPMNTFIGGFTGQEVLKAISAKFTPLNQWLFYDAVECLPSSSSSCSNNYKADDSRYSGQVAVFGKKFQWDLSNLKIFVVGAGAIGCELLKCFALMGIGTGDKGQIIVTDMDLIEKSNLSRQFLFRLKDVGRFKSTTSREAIERLNPTVKIESHQNKVGSNNGESDTIYDEDFYQKLNCIVTAVDNLEARHHMDAMSVRFLKPLLDSGTHGTNGSTQVIIPGRTKNYMATSDPVGQEIPLCTLKYFPNASHHTVQWARELFEEFFKQTPHTVSRYLDGNSIWNDVRQMSNQEKYTMMKSVQQFLQDYSTSFTDCVHWARRAFEELFHAEILQLLKIYPENSLTSDGQQLFWSNGKLCPKPLDFEMEEDNFGLQFVMFAANLRAQVCGIPERVRNLESIRQILLEEDDRGLIIKTGQPTSKTVLANLDEVSEGDLADLEKRMPSPDKYKDIILVPIDFEKDDATNFHIDFITAASNLRSKNYGIPQTDRLQCKLIAGQIIPAISTTTSVVAGLVCLELYKLVHKEEDMIGEKFKFKDCFINLALPSIIFAHPSKAKTTLKWNDVEYNLWSRFQILGIITLKEFIEHFRLQYDLQISAIYHNQLQLYSILLEEEENEPFMNLPMFEVVAKLSAGENLIMNQQQQEGLISQMKVLTFELHCSNVGEDQVVPPVYYFFL